MAFIKERGNENFNIHCATGKNELFKIMVGKGLIKEVNNCLFLYDNITELWCLVNSDWHTLFLPKNGTPSGRYWNITLRKKKLFSNNKKITMKPAQNLIELSDDQVIDVIRQIANFDLRFAEVYSRLKEQLELPPYVLPDIGEIDVEKK